MHTAHYIPLPVLHYISSKRTTLILILYQVQKHPSTIVHDDVVVIAQPLYSSHDRIWNSSSTAITMTSSCAPAQYEMFALSMMSVNALAILLEAFFANKQTHRHRGIALPLLCIHARMPLVIMGLEWG